MKLIPLILTIFLLFTGCIQLETETFEIIEPQEYPIDKVLDGFTFNLPADFDSSRGTYVEVTPSLPNESGYGTFSGTFGTKTRSIFISTSNSLVLYYPGLWHVEYKIYSGTNQSNKILKILGTFDFWVEDKAHDLDRYALYDVDLSNTSPPVLTFKVKNTGKQAGYVDVVVYDKGPIIFRNLTYYGYPYFSEQYRIRPGHSKEIEVATKKINQLYVRLNGETHAIE